MFSRITVAEQNWISDQIDNCMRFVAEHSPADETVTLEALDRAWETWLALDVADTDQVNAAINAVGISFGQLLVDGAGFDWTIASDSFGTDLAVLALPGQGDVLVYPANFVAKRWERNEADFLCAAFEAIREQVAKVADLHSAQKSKPWWRFRS